MLKTDKYLTWISSPTAPRIPLTHEERIALIVKPFPIVKVNVPRGNSQAPNLMRSRREDQ